MIIAETELVSSKGSVDSLMIVVGGTMVLWNMQEESADAARPRAVRGTPSWGGAKSDTGVAAAIVRVLVTIASRNSVRGLREVSDLHVADGGERV